MAPALTRPLIDSRFFDAYRHRTVVPATGISRSLGYFKRNGPVFERLPEKHIYRRGHIKPEIFEKALGLSLYITVNSDIDIGYCHNALY
jgi:hypothetical protein